MYKLFYVFVLLVSGFAQSNWRVVTVSDTIVNFGLVKCYQLHGMELSLQNNLNEPVNVLSAEFEQVEFSTNLTAVEIVAGGSHNFNIYFEGSQNVNHTDFLHINIDKGSHPLIVEVSAQAVYENSYYSSTQNLWGSQLKSTLHDIIDDHTAYPYTSSSTDVWDILKNTDEDPDNSNNVILLYTGWSYAKADQNTGDQNGWNREHVWAKAHGGFDTDPPAGTDVHHLRPTDVTVNSKRGSLDFDNGGSLYTDDDGATGCLYDTYSWEPRDVEKGDVARMMYYMVVRYEGDDTSYDLELVDYIPSNPPDPPGSEEPLFGKQSSLYQWHQDDVVSDWERRRNDRIESYQHNRNPFIDYPEFAARMPSVSGVALTEEPEIVVAPLNVDMGKMAFNATATYAIAVMNTGNQNLSISSVQSTNPDFLLDPTSMNIASEKYAWLHVTFSSQTTEGDFTTTIQLNSNDSDESLIGIPVTLNVLGGTSVVSNPNKIYSYKLEQNYPNPFNPKTIIDYQLPIANYVNLAVYNALGHKVRTLVNEHQEAGEHFVNFNAADLASGVYFYKLVVSGSDKEFSQIRKTILIK